MTVRTFPAAAGGPLKVGFVAKTTDPVPVEVVVPVPPEATCRIPY